MTTLLKLTFCILAVPLIAVVAFLCTCGRKKAAKLCWERDTENWRAHAVRERK